MRDLNTVFFVFNIFIAVLIGGLMSLFPALTRKSFLFGVKIPAEQQGSPEAKALKKSYITICLAGSVFLLALMVVQFAILPDLTVLALMYYPFLFIGVQALAYIPNWRKAVRLKEERGWKVPSMVFADTKSSHSRGNLSELPWGWYIFSFLLIMASIVVTLVQYPGLPDRIPTHFDAYMQPDAWSDKSLFTVLLLPLINLATAFVLWLTGITFIRAKYQIDQHNPELSFTQHRLYRRRLGHSIGFLTLGLTAMMAFIGFMTIFPGLSVPLWVIISLIVAVTVPLITVTVISGQGGFRIKPKEVAAMAADTGKRPAVDAAPGRDDDRYWALGMFYHNPDDPVYIVENRFGNKLGLNYSRLPVKIGIIVLALGVAALYAWITFVLFSVL